MGSCTMLILSILMVPLLVLLALAAPTAIRALAVKLRPPPRPGLGVHVWALAAATLIIIGFIAGGSASLVFGWKQAEPCGQTAMSRVVPTVVCAALGGDQN